MSSVEDVVSALCVVCTTSCREDQAGLRDTTPSGLQVGLRDAAPSSEQRGLPLLLAATPSSEQLSDVLGDSTPSGEQPSGSSSSCEAPQVTPASKLKDVLRSLLEIELEDDGPSLVCGRCVGTIQAWQSLSETARTSRVFFQQQKFLRCEMIQPEPEPESAAEPSVQLNDQCLAAVLNRTETRSRLVLQSGGPSHGCQSVQQRGAAFREDQGEGEPPRGGESKPQSSPRSGLVPRSRASRKRGARKRSGLQEDPSTVDTSDEENIPLPQNKQPSLKWKPQDELMRSKVRPRPTQEALGETERAAGRQASRAGKDWSKPRLQKRAPSMDEEPRQMHEPEDDDQWENSALWAKGTEDAQSRVPGSDSPLSARERQLEAELASLREEKRKKKLQNPEIAALELKLANNRRRNNITGRIVKENTESLRGILRDQKKFQINFLNALIQGQERQGRHASRMYEHRSGPKPQQDGVTYEDGGGECEEPGAENNEDYYGKQRPPTKRYKPRNAPEEDTLADLGPLAGPSSSGVGRKNANKTSQRKAGDQASGNGDGGPPSELDSLEDWEEQDGGSNSVPTQGSLVQLGKKDLVLCKGRYYKVTDLPHQGVSNINLPESIQLVEDRIADTLFAYLPGWGMVMLEDDLRIYSMTELGGVIYERQGDRLVVACK